ncbi:MAG: ABC transporter ATP-binding protein [Planctomycetota bacterium]|nr:ABC transporter ATP-binding protein [Planctomycetota bacterium]
MTNPTLEAIEIRKVYQTLSEEIVVLESVSFSMNAGENLAIIGPSGSGKSTLLQILGTLDAPTSGIVRIGGQDPYELNENQQAKFRNERIGFIFQDHHLLPQWNVLENTLLPALAKGKPTEEIRQRAIALLERVGLKDRMTHLPSQLSGGERERVAVARALVLKPMIVLADEPTGNLDQQSAENVARLLLEVPKEENTVLIVVTHSISLAEQMQKRYELRNRKLTRVG